MKKQYDYSYLDYALKQLESNIEWKKANDIDLKQKLIRDINKRKTNDIFKSVLGVAYRVSIVAVVALIVFIMVKQESLFNQNTSSKSTTTFEQKEHEKKEENTKSVQSIVEKMAGSPEQARTNLGMKEEHYKMLLNEVAVAQKYLSRGDFENLYIPLTSKIIALDGKAQTGDPDKPFNPDLLTPEEKASLKEAAKTITPIRDKFYSLFVYTLEEAQSLVDFAIKKPSYIVEGYELVKEEYRAEITTGTPEPVSRWGYKGGEFGYYVNQASITANYPALSSFLDAKLETYSLEGNQVTYGDLPNSNTNMIKMIVPAQKGNDAYQIIINSDMLNKTELEKILISML